MPTIDDHDFAIPPLPRPPASYGRITGRLVSQGPPAIMGLTSLFSAVLAGWQYYESNNFIAASFTGIAIITCASSACFWKYVGAKAIEESAGDMRSTVVEIDDRIEWFKAENVKLAAEVKKFDDLITKWAQEESINLSVYKKSTGELAITAEDFKTRVEELERFVDLHLQFEAGIQQLKAQLIEFKKIAPDVRSRLAVITDAAEAIQELPNRLEAKITDLSTIDDELIAALSEFRDYVSKFAKCTNIILEVYEKAKQERDDFKNQVEEFEIKNNALETLVKRFEKAQKEIEGRLEAYKELVDAANEVLVDKAEPEKSKKIRVQKRKK